MTEKKPTKRSTTKKKTRAPGPPLPPPPPPPPPYKTVELKSSSLNGRLLHLSITTDLEDKEEIDELHEQIEERIEKKLKENGVENCIVFVSGPNIKLNLF